jgi:hypothetical protein
MYLVTSKWRGSLHIAPMRSFDDLDKAKKYALFLDDEPVIYKLSEIEPPVKIKVEGWCCPYTRKPDYGK